MSKCQNNKCTIGSLRQNLTKGTYFQRAPDRTCRRLMKILASISQLADSTLQLASVIKADARAAFEILRRSRISINCCTSSHSCAAPCGGSNLAPNWFTRRNIVGYVLPCSTNIPSNVGSVCQQVPNHRQLQGILLLLRNMTTELRPSTHWGQHRRWSCNP